MFLITIMKFIWHSTLGEQIKIFLGKEKILKQSPFSRPRVVSKRKRPICYTKDFLAKLNFIEEVYKPWNESYQIASLKFRKGELKTLFPEFSIKPPLLYLVCLLYTSPSPRDRTRSRMPSSA